ncbi:uncharacterized protein [Dermacentor andersoni]|uniref:uncharacterized protein isoform X1 n=1 Tax=Dermacentor andersoni TaxID=34620 RepID=UPI003B3A3C7C
MKECLFLHCDVAGRPYRLEDFRDPLQELGVLKDVTGTGPFQMTHVWLIKLRTPEVKEVLVRAGGLEVKGRFCAVIDPVQQDITLKVHWVPFHVTGEALKKAFDHYGEVKEVRQEDWKVRGFEQAESTTRIVRMTLRENLTPDALPHWFKIFGGSVLVVVPGRAPICLRCRRKGHIRRDCRVPRCSECREFGHEAHDCVRTYARVTGSTQPDDEGLELMEEEVTEKPTASSETPVQQVASVAKKVATPSASTQDATAGRKQRERRRNEEEKTPSAPAETDHGCDALRWTRSQRRHMRRRMRWSLRSQPCLPRGTEAMLQKRRRRLTVFSAWSRSGWWSGRPGPRKGSPPHRNGQRRSPEKGRRRNDQRDWCRGCPLKLSCRQGRSVDENKAVGKIIPECNGLWQRRRIKGFGSNKLSLQAEMITKTPRSA